MRAAVYGLSAFRIRSGWPSCQPSTNLRLGRKVTRLPLQHSLIDPGANSRNLLLGKPPLVGKLHIARFRQPWRHKPRLRHRNNLLAVLLHVLISEQRKRTRLARPVARNTVMENDWSNVAIEGYAGRRCVRLRAPCSHRNQRYKHNADNTVTDTSYLVCHRGSLQVRDVASHTADGRRRRTSVDRRTDGIIQFMCCGLGPRSTKVLVPIVDTTVIDQFSLAVKNCGLRRDLDLT